MNLCRVNDIVCKHYIDYLYSELSNTFKTYTPSSVKGSLLVALGCGPRECERLGLVLWCRPRRAWVEGHRQIWSTCSISVDL